MASIPPGQPRRKVVVGVDTHKHVHVAVALDALGGRFGGLTIPATTDGYAQLERWARALGDVAAVGVEGTGSYGSRLTEQQHGGAASPNQSGAPLKFVEPL